MSSQKPQEIDFFEKEVKMTPPSRQDREGTYNFIFPFNNFNNKFMYPRDADVRNFKPFSDLKNPKTAFLNPEQSQFAENHPQAYLYHKQKHDPRVMANLGLFKFNDHLVYANDLEDTILRLN